MAWDTKYRPRRFEDVLGQEGTVTTVRNLILHGKGLHNSYLISGKHGSGKTTLGRIVARALLCDDPREGSPCDQCDSCKSILDRGSSDALSEMDAASAGKDEVEALKQALTYDTFSGKRRIIIIDEAHELSRQAQDALLKPLEDTVPGSNDKILVCIFCTTEAEKIRPTIKSRCLHFTIRPVPEGKLVERVATVCKAEGVAFEEEALRLLANVCNGHIRDVLKTAEGISAGGDITVARVRDYTGLDANGILMDILLNLGTDLQAALNGASQVYDLISPTDCYTRLVNIAMMAFRQSVGAGSIPHYWDENKVKEIAEKHGDRLLNFANRLSRKPKRPTLEMMLCDLGTLHHIGRSVGIVDQGAVVVVQQSSPTRIDPAGSAKTSSNAPATPVQDSGSQPPPLSPAEKSESAAEPASSEAEKGPFVDSDGIYKVSYLRSAKAAGHENRASSTGPKPMDREEFVRLLRRHVEESKRKGSSAWMNEMSRPG